MEIVYDVFQPLYQRLGMASGIYSVAPFHSLCEALQSVYLGCVGGRWSWGSGERIGGGEHVFLLNAVQKYLPQLDLNRFLPNMDIPAIYA